MGDAKIAPRPHTPENDDQGGNLVETVTSATAGGAKPAVIAARGSYLKTASYFDEPDAGQSTTPAFYRHVLDLVKPSGVMIALFLIYAMQQVLVMIALGLGQSGNGVRAPRARRARAPRRSGGCARRLSHGDPPPLHASFAWSLTRRSKLLDRDNRRHVRGERSRAERRHA